MHEDIRHGPGKWGIHTVTVAVPGRGKDKAAYCKFSKDLKHEPKEALAKLFQAVGPEVSAIKNVRKYILLHLNPVWSEKMTEINVNY